MGAIALIAARRAEEASAAGSTPRTVAAMNSDHDTDPSGAREAVASAGVALAVFAACVAAFFPPFNERFLGSPLIVTLLGLAIATSLVLHLVYVGIAARRLRRSPLRWVAGALIGFPIVSLVAYALFEWQRSEHRHRAA